MTIEIYFCEFVKRDLIVYKERHKNKNKKTTKKWKKIWRKNEGMKKSRVNRKTHCVN